MLFQIPFTNEHLLYNLLVIYPDRCLQFLCNLETGYKVLTPAEVEAEEVEKDSELDGFDVIIECSGFPPAIEKVILNFFFFRVSSKQHTSQRLGEAATSVKNTVLLLNLDKKVWKEALFVDLIIKDD